MILPSPHPKLHDIRNETANFFSKETPLANAEKYGGRKYEDRPQQKEMATYTAEALINDENLCVEAPTGVGKSFAYIVPAALYSVKKKKPVIISTETINLQEQLINKDIPIIQKLLKISFTACLAKGRGNYLCKRRLELVTGEQQGEYLPNNSMMPEIARISNWARTTSDGSLSGLDFEPSSATWGCVCCEGINCFGPKCKFMRQCFYWNARKQWEKANLIVSNHALFFSDLKMHMVDNEEMGLLPVYSAVIIDEAHQLEANAAKHLGTRIFEPGIYNMLNRLFNPANIRGLLIRPGEKAIELRQLVAVIFDFTKTFFNSLRNHMSQFNEQEKRICTPGIVEDVITGQLALLERKLDEYIKEQSDENYKLELTAQLLRCREYAKAIFEFLMMRAEDSVYWIETENSTPRMSITLNYSPLNIAEILKKHLFMKGPPVILTSATLSVANKLDFYKARTGFDGIEKILSSPFNYAKQAAIYIPKTIPDPSEEMFESELAEHIKKYIDKTHGKAFVLFTSYNLLAATKKLTADYFEEKNIRLLVQGDGMSRSNMIKIFKEDINSVIFGTTSFWMGVDIPGEALSNVIITKLPFAVPTEPIIEARLEKLQKEGKNAFMEYSLPEAVLRLKQGIGRLIRSKEDKGIIVILDNRVISKRYGKIFLDSLPPCPIILE